MRDPLPDINALPLDQAFRLLNPPANLRALFQLARHEDLGKVGDVTTRALKLQGGRVQGSVVARRAGTICGWRAIPAMSDAFAGAATCESLVPDGAEIELGVSAGILRGPEEDVLALERPLLNLMGRLSGIATLTQRFVRSVHGTKAKIFDTRKTTPGWRGLEKYAVRCGGGHCHRLGLYDAILVKDNHLAGIEPDDLTHWLNERLRPARDNYLLRFVEVEVDALDQLRAVLNCASGLIDIVLLDNMKPAQVQEAIRMRDDLNPKIELEASGGVTLDTVAAVAATGIDRIAVGALTHSAMPLDLGLDFRP